MDRKIRCALIATGGITALLTGYLWGYGVGEREGLDSDAEQSTDHMTSTPLPTSVWGSNGG